MTNKKFTVAAVVAAAITAAPIAAPAISAIAPVFAATTSQNATTNGTLSDDKGTAVAKKDDSIIYNNKNITVANNGAGYASKYTTYNVVSVFTSKIGSKFYVTDEGQYLPVNDFNFTATNATIGTAVAKKDDSIIYNNKNITVANNGAGYASKYTTYNVVSVFTSKIGSKFYVTDEGQYLPVNDFNYTSATPVKDDTKKQTGTITVNYNPKYGIQVWTKEGKMVKYNAADAAAFNKLKKGYTVKAGDAKKLPGKTSWKVFNAKYTANGTTYYNLGNDQYIDANYVTFHKLSNK